MYYLRKMKYIICQELPSVVMIMSYFIHVVDILVLAYFWSWVFSDFNNIFLWHGSEDINKKAYQVFPKFQLIPILHFQVMHDYVCFIAPIDYCVE